MTPAVRTPPARDPLERDAAARRAAQREFDRPLLLEAGAGTGKTATLVARVVAWSLGPGWERATAARAGASAEAIAARALGRIVAITFTEAAAAEMATRVAEALEALVRGTVPPGVDPDCLPPAAHWRDRARALVGALDHMVVCTIHAFARRLLSAHCVDAGLHPRFEVDADGALRAAAVREALEAELERGYANPDWLALAEEGFGPRDFEAELCAFADASLPPEALREDPFAGPGFRELLDDVARETDALLALERGRLRAVARANSSSPAALDALERIAATLRDARPTDAAAAEALVRALPESSEKAMERLEDWAAEKPKTELQTLGADAAPLAEHAERLQPLLEHLLELRPLLFDRARRVLGGLWSTVARELRRRGVTSFEDLLRGARDLVCGNRDLAARAREEIDQLLVDEFQDTDSLQGELVACLGLEGPAGRRPGLFVVGDPKQSIYGWRSADLRAYERFRERLVGEGGRVESLLVSFRSVPAVLDEVERIVQPVMTEVPGVQPPFERLLPAPHLRGESGFRAGDAAPIEYWVSWSRGGDGGLAAGNAEDAAELEARALAADIADLHARAGVPFRDVGVLMRSRGELDTYLAALRDAGVPYAVDGDRSYYRRREVIEAAALVRCVLDRHDQLSLLAVLRSAAVGVPDAALLPLWRAGLPEAAAALGGDPAALARAIDAVARACAKLPAGVPGLERVAGWDRALVHLLCALAALRESFAADPADAFVETLRRSLQLEVGEAARAQGSYRIANLERLFRGLARDLDAQTGGTPALLRQLRQRVEEAEAAEEARPARESADAVRVLTIHQAKGLDFVHVYLVGVQRRPPQGRASAGATVLRREGGFELRLLGAASPGFVHAARERGEVEVAERVRTLYVATTRAKRRLVIAGSWPDGRAAAEGSHLDLLQGRQAGMPEPVELAERCVRAGSAHVDEREARWVFPALRGGAVPAAGAPPPASEIERIRADSALIRARAERARERMQRPFSSSPSRAAHAGLEQMFERVGRDVAERGVPEDVAFAVGTAVHAVLERLDFGAPIAAALGSERAALRTALAHRLDGEALARAEALARDGLDRLASGPLAPRLAALHGRVVARELPFVAPPEGDSAEDAVAFVSGAIDLVYRDPASERIVVADWKTDRVESDAEIADRRAAYAPQVRAYARALRSGLGLDYEPRAEIWFLYPGRVEAV